MNQASLASLFASDRHWHDILAPTWPITPNQGAETIAALMLGRNLHQGIRVCHRGREHPAASRELGRDRCRQGHFQFATGGGRGFGVLRLLANEPSKAFKLTTSLHELQGFEETIGNRCLTGKAFSQNFSSTNHNEQCEVIQAYADREPVVLIVGTRPVLACGHAWIHRRRHTDR